MYTNEKWFAESGDILSHKVIYEHIVFNNFVLKIFKELSLLLMHKNRNELRRLCTKSYA